MINSFGQFDEKLHTDHYKATKSIGIQQEKIVIVSSL